MGTKHSRLIAKPGTPAVRAAQLWICESCGFVYDAKIGDPDSGISPGTALEDLDDTWSCPMCGARKQDFTPEL
jgi:rubredoxin